MYDNLDEYLMAHNMTMAEYKRKQAIKQSNIAHITTYLKKKNKEKQMEKTPTFTIKKRNNAPDFVFGSFGCKLEDLKAYVNDKGYVNFDILAGKEGGYYVKVSDYGIKSNVTKSDTQGEVLEFDEMPF